VKPSEDQSQLADALKRAFDSYVAGVTPPLPGSPERRSRSSRLSARGFARIPEFRLTALIRGELGTYPGSASAEGAAGADEVRPEVPKQERQPFDGLAVHEMLELLAAKEAQPDTLAIARRVARYMTGPPRPLWQYIAVSLAPAFPLAVFGGWELAPIDLVRDEELPLGYGYVSYLYSPGAFHLEHGYGALRHPSGEGDVPNEASESDEPVLTLPLLALNLASDHPEHVGVFLLRGTGTERHPAAGSPAGERRSLLSPQGAAQVGLRRPPPGTPAREPGARCGGDRTLAMFAPDLAAGCCDWTGAGASA
jgi:hypothetical protein